MRICTFALGTDNHCQRWVKYLADQGHEVHMISTSFDEGLDSRIHRHHLSKRLPTIWGASRYLNAPLWPFQSRRFVKSIEPDIVDALYIGVPAYLAMTSGFHPLMLVAFGSDLLIDTKGKPIRKFLTTKVVRSADHIICVSNTLKEELIKLGASPNKVEIIPIGVDIKRFSPDLRNEALLRELDIAGSPIVISIRNLKPVYDVETLIKAIPLVLQGIPEAKFIIGGEGPQRDYLESLAKRLGIFDSVKFIGWISDKEFPGYLASSDVYVSTSLSDGTSVSLLEALACELAPVVTDIPANRPWINDGENGFLIPVGDYHTLAKRIILLIQDNETRSRYGRLGRNKVIEKAEYDKHMFEVARIYEELKDTKSQTS